jgi:DNA-binding MarR family transcriptional regulator
MTKEDVQPGKRRRTPCPEEVLFLDLLRTTDMLTRALDRILKTGALSGTQYNVLRILRGAQPHGLTCSAIGDRMITAEPDITRLLTRLKGLKLIHQKRDRHDRRVVWTQISEPGLALLARMDPFIQKAPKEILGHMDSTQLADLIRLLELARTPCQESLRSGNANHMRSER